MVLLVSIFAAVLFVWVGPTLTRERMLPAARLVMSLTASGLIVVPGVLFTGSYFVADPRRVIFAAGELVLLPTLAIFWIVMKSPLAQQGRVFAAGTAAILSVILWGVAGLLLVLVNRELEQGPARHIRDVAEVTRSSVKNRTEVSISVRSWIDPTRRLTVGHCTEPDCPSFETMVNLTVRPGGLGWEWIERFDFDDSR